MMTEPATVASDTIIEEASESGAASRRESASPPPGASSKTPSQVPATPSPQPPPKPSHLPAMRCDDESSAASFRSVLQCVDAFVRLASSDQLVALSLLIPRLSPLQLSFVSTLAARQFDKVPYADGRKCDEMRAQAIDTSYLNELYTRAFQADQVPDVLNELAQLLPVAQLAGATTSSTKSPPTDSAKLIHLYANMLMHCFNRNDDAHVQRLVQALAMIQPDVRDHLLQTTQGAPSIVTNGECFEDDESSVFHRPTAPKIIPAELMIPLMGGSTSPQHATPPSNNGNHHYNNQSTPAPGLGPVQRPGHSQLSSSSHHHSPLSITMSMPAQNADSASSNLSSVLLPHTLQNPSVQNSAASNLGIGSGTYHHPHYNQSQQLPGQSSLSNSPAKTNVTPQGVPLMGSGQPVMSLNAGPRLHVSSSPQPYHQAISRQRTMPEGSSLASLAQHRQLQGATSISPGGSNLSIGGSSNISSSAGCVFVMEGSGMRDVPIWLKNLRLHKYTPLFEKMTYEEMMALTEEWLEAHKVTKGATNKILQNIAKLRERQSQLRFFEREILQNPNVDTRSVLDSLHQMMNTPIKRFTPPATANGATPETTQAQATENQGSSNPDNMQWILGDDTVPEGDLPGQMTRLVGRLMCYFLIKSAAMTEPSLLIHFIKLVDKCAQHEAFTDKHRTLLSQARQRCQAFVHASSPRSQWSPASDRAGSGQSGGIGFRKGRGMQSELRASPSVPASMTSSRNGVVGDGLTAQASTGAMGYNLSPSRNFWAEHSQVNNGSSSSAGNGTSQQQNSNNGSNGTSADGTGSQMPLGTSYSLRAAQAIGLSGRPPPHSMNNNSSQQNSLVDQFLPSTFVNSMTPPTISTTQATPGSSTQPSSISPGGAPPGFSSKQFRPPGIVGAGLLGAPGSGKMPLGRTQSAPQTQPGGSLLMMSFAGAVAGGAGGSRGLSNGSQGWGPSLTGSTTSASSSTGAFGAPGSHLPLSPQASNASTQRQPVSYEAELFANSQLNTLCLQMTDVCLNAPDFAEDDERDLLSSSGNSSSTARTRTGDGATTSDEVNEMANEQQQQQTN